MASGGAVGSSSPGELLGGGWRRPARGTPAWRGDIRRRCKELLHREFLGGGRRSPVWRGRRPTARRRAPSAVAGWRSAASWRIPSGSWGDELQASRSPVVEEGAALSLLGSMGGNCRQVILYFIFVIFSFWMPIVEVACVDGEVSQFLVDKKIEQSATEFLVDKVSQFHGEISVLALGPLMNVALAIKRDSSFASKVKKIVVLGGSFFAAGNATPSAEANIHSDPEAADIVFTSGADIYVVGLNMTTQVSFTDDDLLELRNSKGKHAQFLCDVCKFYRDWHIKSYGAAVIFLHDPVSFAALVRPEYFTFRKGVVRVETQGICAGHTSMDVGLKKWNSENPWTGYSPISVAWTVDVPKVVAFVKELVTKQ